MRLAKTVKCEELWLFLLHVGRYSKFDNSCFTTAITSYEENRHMLR
jgi:hypothetical protein